MTTAGRRAVWCAVVALACVWPAGPAALAFGPAAHVSIAEAVAKALPAGSVVRAAMEADPGVAAAGSCGPDLGYLDLRGLVPDPALRYTPWGNRFHYDRVGTFAATQLRMALASGDKAKTAWAAGWVTHIAGDLACHSLYVNPEAGVWMAVGQKQRDLHEQLERYAEPYVWEDLGGHGAGSYNSRDLRKSFCDEGRLPTDLISKASVEVYGHGIPGGDLDGFRAWYGRLLTGVGKELFGLELGYKFTSHAEAVAALGKDDRLAHLELAFHTAVLHATELLKAAEAGDYTAFTDRWNLDAGPVGTLTVTVHTARSFGAGTDSDIFFGLALADGAEHEWLLDKPGYNDFERGDTDDYYLYFPNAPGTETHIARVWLRMGGRHGVGPEWRCDSILVCCNGQQVCKAKVDKRFNKNDRWELKLGAD